ncbi:DUF6148 family protein [Spartinivicinus ruber]|uniref:DUF6148 family protein n=1 Tax=Spartinivicinus ruber TaxID=2683272 RepID=UPI0013D7831D|nr:DUF6148 family protein [Spartinivicinus ruber]
MTLTEAKSMLRFYLEAEQAVLSGKSITKGDRNWTRENLAEIRQGRQEWESKVRQLQSSGRQWPSLAEFE